MGIDDFFDNITGSIFARAEFPTDHPEYPKLYELVKSDMSRLYATTSVTMGLSYDRANLIQEQEETFIKELQGIKEGRWPEE